MGTPNRRRIRCVRRLLAEGGADALLLAHPPNIFYLSGFSGSAGALLVEPGRVTLFTDSRYTTQAREEARGARVRITRGALLTAVGEYLRKRGKARVAFEPARLSVAQHRELRRAAGRRIRWAGLEGGIEGLRAVKDAGEIARMRQAAQVGCAVFLGVLPLVKPGVREIEIAAEIEYRMRQRGASGAAFPTIVASGARAALPHAQPTAKKLRKNELVVLDLGAILGHYCCDLTRTVFVGRAPARIRRWYQAVREAQAAARDTLRAGVAVGDVDATARRVLKGFRLEHRFLHSTGHGLGLEVHEEPRLAKGQKKLIQAGNVVTLEPGVYVQGVGGIRIEDDVAVFPDRTEVLTSAPREFLEL
jgi:Xaa-Pro aminopeptidase